MLEAPAAPSAAPMLATDQPSSSAPSPVLRGLLDSLAGALVLEGVRVHRVKADGSRGEMLFTAAGDDHPDTIRERITRYGAGEYELAPVVNGRYQGGSRRMVVDAPEESRQLAPAPAAPIAAGSDMRSLVDSFSAAMRDMQSNMMQQLGQMELRNKDSQLELMKEVLKSNRTGGGSGAGSELSTLLLPMLVAKLSEDPFDRLVKMNAINRELREDAAPPDTTGRVFEGLAGALASMLSMVKSAPQQPAAPGMVRSVTLADDSRAPAAPAPAAVPADSSEQSMRELMTILLRMARKGSDPDTVLAVLEETLMPAEYAQLVAVISTPGIEDGLVSIEPAFEPHREWLATTIEKIRDMIKDDQAQADTERAPASPVDGSASAAE
jgi:hypothetical protein